MAFKAFIILLNWKFFSCVCVFLSSRLDILRKNHIKASHRTQFHGILILLRLGRKRNERNIRWKLFKKYLNLLSGKKRTWAYFSLLSIVMKNPKYLFGNAWDERRQYHQIRQIKRENETKMVFSFRFSLFSSSFVLYILLWLEF